jgi:putative ATPase
MTESSVPPLAERLRPKSLDEFVGQAHLVGKGKPIRRLVEQKQPFSMIFWGPPGVGKTTLAKIIAESTGYEFVYLSAVSRVKMIYEHWLSLYTPGVKAAYTPGV